MDVLDIFLNELRRRIHAVSADVTEITEKRNKALEIENLLFANDINKNDIKLEDLLNLSIKDFKKIAELILIDNYQINIEKFNEYRNIIHLYREVSMQGEVSVAPQYDEALNYFNNIINMLTSFMNYYTSENTTEQIDSKEVVNVLKKLEKAFSGGKLVVPILETDKFNRIVNLCNLSPLQKGQLKKWFGVETLRVVLLPSNQRDEEQELLLKYKVILNKRLHKAKSYINILGIFIEYNEIKLDVNVTNELLRFFVEGNPTLSFKEVINGIMHILLERELKRFDDLLATNHTDDERRKLLTEIIRNCDKVLLLGDLKLEDIKIKEVQGKSETLEETPVVLNKEAKAIVDKIKVILHEEEGFLQSIHPDNYSRYAQLQEIIHAKEAAGEKDETYEAYTLAMIIEQLKQELKAFEIIASRYVNSPKEFKNNYIQQVITTNGFIDAYEILRRRRPGQKIKDNNHLLYLTDENEEALINKFMEETQNDKRKQVIEIIEKLAENTLPITEANADNDFEVKVINNKNVYISFIKQSDEDIIILSAGNRAKKNENNELEVLINSYRDKINSIIKKTKNKADRQIMFEEQASSRNILAKYVESLNSKSRQSQKAA